jgi:hypothetical protein
MEVLEIIMEGIKYAIPAALVLITVKYMNDSNLKKQSLNQSMLVKDELLKQHLPLRITAHERALLYLERISPQNLLMRMAPQGGLARDYQKQLLAEIRSEYEHNMVQQLYVSNPAWTALQQARDEMISIINQAMAALHPEAHDLELAQQIVSECSKMKESKIHTAIFLLKKDVSSLFKL